MSRKRRTKELQHETTFVEERVKRIEAKTPGQRVYMDAIRDNDIVLCNGVWGSGKTLISISLAIEYLRAGRVKSIIVSRPAISACGEEQGHYPGSYQEKLEPFMLPLLEQMRMTASPAEIKKWIEDEKVRLMPISLLRGHNWNDVFVVIDEAANLTFEQFELILSRFGQNCKLVISGHFLQSDLPARKQGAFEDFFEILEGMNGVGLCHLTVDDIVRSPFIGEIMKRVQKFKEKDKEVPRYF